MERPILGAAKGKCYNHLSLKERVEIYYLLKSGLGCAQIAKAVGRNRATVTREIKPNSPVSLLRILADAQASHVLCLPGPPRLAPLIPEMLRPAPVRKVWPPRLYKTLHCREDCATRQDHIEL